MSECPCCKGVLLHDIADTYRCQQCRLLFLLDEKSQTILVIGNLDNEKDS